MRPLTARQILSAARQILSSRFTWTKRTPAKDMHGNSVEPTSAKACAWCATGVLDYVANGDTAAKQEAIRILSRNVGGNIVGWNDSSRTTHEDILNGFDKAIAQAR